MAPGETIYGGNMTFHRISLLEIVSKLYEKLQVLVKVTGTRKR